MALNTCEACVDGTQAECRSAFAKGVVMENLRTQSYLEQLEGSQDVDELLVGSSLESRATAQVVHARLGEIGCLLTQEEVAENIAFFREEIRKRQDGS